MILQNNGPLVESRVVLHWSFKPMTTGAEPGRSSIGVLMEKRCSQCNEVKHSSLFNKNRTRKDGLQTFCRECSIILNRQRYLSNRDHHCRVMRENRSKYRQNIRSWFREYKKTISCIRCGENHPSTLDFHHNDPNVKELNIAKMVAQYSKEKILSEIEKCSVLCANCHRKLHYKDI